MHTTATARSRRVVTRPFRGVGRPVAFLTTGVLIQLGVLFVLALPCPVGGPTVMTVELPCAP